MVEASTTTTSSWASTITTNVASGDAERISQEAPVILLRADKKEERLGGASSVATMLRALGAKVSLADLSEMRKTNTSSHRKYIDYYDDETRQLVVERDRLIIADRINHLERHHVRATLRPIDVEEAQTGHI